MSDALSSVSPAAFEPALLVPCRDLGEAAFLLGHLSSYRQKAAASPEANLGDLGSRMLANLREPYLKPGYRELLAHLAAQTAPVHNGAVAEALGLTPKQPGAMMAKLSGRMRAALHDAEKRNYRSPVYVLVDVGYDDANSSYYELTLLGRRVVDVLLAD